ncbi:hypothetical protein B566_EDAN017916 [Ephemera danica]|nr:hypothetical protein B566_EDAN017916 [Ephemera danica]
MREPTLPRQLGPYQVIRRLGRGSTGQVLLATLGEGGRLVALKVLRQEVAGEARSVQSMALARFRQGLAMARRLQHPDIAEIYDDGFDAPWLWVAMELLPGCSLERYAQAPRLLPEVLAVSLGVRLARALGYAHEQGVLHRDVKPANVIVNLPTHSAKLTDFGLSCATDSSSTQTGVVLGSPAYMAPELLAGAAGSVASDVYSLGVLLFQLLTGRLPYEDASLAGLLIKVAQAPAPRVQALCPHLPPALGEVVARALAKSARERFHSATAFADALQQQLGALGQIQSAHQPHPMG